MNNDSKNGWPGENCGDKDLKLGDMLKLQIQRQPAYKEYCQSHAPNPFVGHLNINSDEATIVDYLRQKLKIGCGNEYVSSRVWYECLVERIGALGIFFYGSYCGEDVFIPGKEDYSGFAVADRYLPIICIHPAVAPQEGVLRLVFQLSQICLGLSGIYGYIEGEAEGVKLCQAVTEAFLVPEKAFSELWQPDLANWQANLWPLERHFKTDQRLLARRALKLGYIGEKDYSDFIAIYHNDAENGASHCRARH